MRLSFHPHCINHFLPEAMPSNEVTSVLVALSRTTSSHSQLTNSHNSSNLRKGSTNTPSTRMPVLN